MKITNELFETKISYEKVSEQGKNVKATDCYLVDAVNFADAETKTIEFSLPFITGSYQVQSVKRVKISEVFEFPSGDKWFKLRINFVWVDEKGKDKKDPYIMFVQACDIKEARERLEESMKETMADYEVVKIEETAVLEILNNIE